MCADTYALSWGWHEDHRKLHSLIYPVYAPSLTFYQAMPFLNELKLLL